ncbi:MAG: ABC transporter ATP-binding protein [Poseidonia sp.]|jgi:sodium transport system ATP-binding protein
MAKPLLHVNNVSKSFGDITALDRINLAIHEGEIVGLVGSNGAGKTTLLRLLAGVYRPTTGHVLTADGAAIEHARGVLGVVPENTGLYSRLTAWENIRYHARMQGVEDELAWKRTLYFAHHLGMEEALGRHTKGFSRGMRQKTALLRALAHAPRVLLLDEPTAGLDVTSARTVRELVRQLGEDGGTVIYSTHQLAEAERVCDRIIIIHNGEVRADGTPQELLQMTDTDHLEDAYVKLTADTARQRHEDDKPLSKWSTRWRALFTPKVPSEVMEDE